MKTGRPEFAPSVRFRVDPVRNAPVLLYPEGVIELNETAYEVAKLCDGKRTLDEIVNTLAGEYDTSRDQIAQDAADFVGDLTRRNLLVNRP